LYQNFTKVCLEHLGENSYFLNAITQGLLFLTRPFVLKREELTHFLQGLRIYTNNKVNARYIDQTDFSDAEFK